MGTKKGRATGICCVETMDAAKWPVMCRAAATTENHPVQNVSSTEIEKLCSAVMIPIKEIPLQSCYPCQLFGILALVE